MAPRGPARAPRARGPRRAGVRHGGQLAPLAAHGRACPRDRSLERLADPLLRHPAARLGRRADRPPPHPAGGVPRGPPVGRSLRRDGRPRRAPGRPSGGGDRRGPAGRPLRSGRAGAGRREEHVRDGLLPPAQHRPDAGRLGSRPPHDGGLVAPAPGRRAGRRRVRARRRGLRRGRRRPVAPGRARSDHDRRRDRAPGALGAGHRRRLSRPRLRGTRGPLLGHVRARRPGGTDARHDPRPRGAGDARGDRLPDARRARGDGRERPAAGPRSSGSTAARPRTTSSVSSRRTSSASPSCGRGCARRPRSEPRIWPGSGRESGEARRPSATSGSSTAPSSPPCPPARRDALYAGWRRAVDRARGWAREEP